MLFRDRITCSVQDAIDASRLGKTKLYALISDGRLETVKVDGRRLVRIESLLRLLGENPTPSPPLSQTADVHELGRTEPKVSQTLQQPRVGKKAPHVGHFRPKMRLREREQT